MRGGYNSDEQATTIIVGSNTTRMRGGYNSDEQATTIIVGSNTTRMRGGYNKADENRYQRDMTTVKLIENEEQIYPIEEILIGIGFIDAGIDENRCHIFNYHDYYSHKYFSYIPLTGEAECVQVFADGSGEETTETIFLSKGVYNLYGILCAMRMSGIDIKQLLKP